MPKVAAFHFANEKDEHGKIARTAGHPCSSLLHCLSKNRIGMRLVGDGVT
jgi:hypothetical protein